MKKAWAAEQLRSCSARWRVEWIEHRVGGSSINMQNVWKVRGCRAVETIEWVVVASGFLETGFFIFIFIFYSSENFPCPVVTGSTAASAATSESLRPKRRFPAGER